MASFLPLKRLGKAFRFLRYASAVGRQLEGTAGVVGFSVRASVFRKRFWTLSAWESTGRLMEFVRTAPHVDVMKGMKGHMQPTKFLQWRVAGSDLPPSWDDALRRLDAP